MNATLISTLILPALLLLATALVPSFWANRHAQLLRRVITGFAGLHFSAACSLLAMFLFTGMVPYSETLLGIHRDLNLSLSLYIDGSSALMLTLVSFVGWIICQYSIRYLDGESRQGRYYRWTAFTIGAVSMMVISGNLLMFFAAWVMTSMGLHQLLMHYPDRPQAGRAAWTKFAISRIGDIALITALILIYQEFGTLEFAELFAAVQTFSAPVSLQVSLIGWMLVLGAVTKSAQFPFHTWLPQTMETPTPVSALMHAGVVNAGGYLIIRTSPLITFSPWAMVTLAIIGAFTACFAATIMLTQTSIKKSLAYSTVAQMGFMMLQCGLGAFSVAMLHILAHSLYKAHAFLGSGGVMAKRAATSGASLSPQPNSNRWLTLLVSAALSTSAFAFALFTFGINPATKTGGFVLGSILCLAFTGWLWKLMQTNALGLKVTGAAITFSLAFAYTLSFYVVDKIVSPGLSGSVPANEWLMGGFVALSFGGLFILHNMLQSPIQPRWLQAFYVHASNGFYFDAAYRRIFGTLT